MFMKKSLLLIFALCSIVWLQVEAATTNGTVVNGYYIIEDFDGTAPTFSNTGSTCVLETYPVAGRGQSVKLSVTSNNGYFTIPVTLPDGVVLSNNDSLLIDLYHLSGTFKRLRVHLGSTHAGSSSVAYDYGSNFLGGTTPLNKGTVRVGINQLTGYATAGNSFRFGFGIDYGTTVVYIDNIKLKYTLSTAPTATDATEITASGFQANWNALFGVENYRLDVATDAAFTSMVSGYNNLNVGNVLTYQVTGLDENTTYYYRVRGAKSNGTSPSSSTITVLTQAAGPVDPYVAPNLDPVAETDPTPATITVPTIFVIDDYESRSIDDALSVNAPSFTTASVKANPTNGSQKSAYVRVTNWDGYLRMNVQLPEGKVLADYAKLSFDEYLQSGYDQNYKDIKVYFNSVEQFSVASGGTTTNAWTTREFNLAGKSAGNTFVLDIGMRTPNGSYFIDNVKLSPAPAPTATTATAATHIYATSFKAQWSLFQGSTAYFLDVATNNTFTNMVSGYNNLNVGNVANYVVTGLTPGTTYYYRVRGTNTSTQSNTITVATKAGTTAASHFATRASGNISDIATWQSSTNNAAWMNSTAAPTGNAKSIRILKGHRLTVDDNFSGAEIIVRAGGQLSVASGKVLELSGRLFLESTEADGTATFINEGTLTVPANNAIVKQYLSSKTRPLPVGETPASNDDWWYISSPVSGATSAVFDPASTAETRNRIGYFNEATQLYPQILTNDVALTSGKGYLVKLGANSTVAFEGALNDGAVNVDITRTGTSVAKRGFNLVGNPYPSYLNWNMVRGSRTDISTGIWYRTRNEGGEMVFDTYNGLSGTSLGKKGAVNQYIPPMQAFWVRVLNDGVTGNPVQRTLQLNFTNEMRSHQNQALPANQLRAPASTGVGTLRLELSNNIHRDEALILVYQDALNGIDKYDAPKFSNNNTNIPEIFTVIDSEELTINTLKSIPYNSTLNLGVRPGKSGQFTISATEVQFPDTQVDLILKDNVTSTETELYEGASYTFSSDNTVSTDRFSILFKSTGSITIEEENQTGSISVSVNANRQLVVTTAKALSPSATVTVYNTLGQKILTRALTGTITPISISLDNGVYLLIVDDAGKQTSLKAILN